MAFLFVLKYVLSTCKTLFLESCTASTTMFSLLIPYLAPFFSIFHPRHQITGGNITYIHSTHTPLARRDHRAAFHSSCTSISTHTSLARRDLNFDHMYRHDRNFYSHAPCGARRFTRACLDVISRFLLTRPCGARRDRSAATNTGDRFLLTRPMRGATDASARNEVSYIFLLTRPMRGATGRSKWVCRCECDFYSHASCEARLSEN